MTNLVPSRPRTCMLQLKADLSERVDTVKRTSSLHYWLENVVVRSKA